MMVIATALQMRILDAASRHLGASGEQFVQQVARDGLGSSLDTLTYDRLPALFSAIERQAPPLAGEAPVIQLAGALDDLAASLDAELSERLTAALSGYLGPAAAAFLHTLCTRLGTAPNALRRSDIVPLAELAGRMAGEMLGRQPADELAATIRAAGTGARPGLAATIERCSLEHAGVDGPVILRRFCRERIEVDLEELDQAGITLLAGIVRRDGAAVFGEHATAAFLSAVREAVSGPGSGVRARLRRLAQRHIGPAAEIFLTRVCIKNGLPFEALSYEHLHWLAARLQDEAAPYIGAEEAATLARETIALLDVAA